MSLRRRLFLTLSLLIFIGFFGIANWIRGELRNSYAQVIEEVLVDIAHLVSAQIENQQMSKASFQSLHDIFAAYKTHQINSKIFDFIKTNPTLELYITDLNGIVLFSSREEEIGKDFSKWNDVYKTLRGEYGSRSTRIISNDSKTSVYYVAAPIKINSKIAGVITIYKTEMSILIFLEKALNKMFLGGLFAIIALGVLGGLIMLWITLPLEKLRKYAIAVSMGSREPLPKSNIKEIRQLGDAFEKMRISLEGKKSIEKYTQSLTHELKSPLTAIKGAAELCLEEMDPTQRNLFLNNIIVESNRSHKLLEQLLKIAALESKKELDQTSSIDVFELLNEVKEALIGFWQSKSLNITIISNKAYLIAGDRFLLFQSLRNIIQNSIEFSENHGQINIDFFENDRSIIVKITDFGIGIPNFAIDRIFEKFYSLERPDTKRKSSGLGLSFVKEVIELHKGEILIKSPIQNERGTSVLLTLPKANYKID